MIATDLSDILFGTPSPLSRQVNLGVLKEDEVNIVVHGHEPTLSEMIVAAAQDPELIAYAKTKGAKGINLAGICCTANEILMRHGIRWPATSCTRNWPSSPAPSRRWWWTCSASCRRWRTLAPELPHQAHHHLAQGQDPGREHIEFDEHHASTSPRRSSGRPSTTTRTAARRTSPTSRDAWWPASRTSTSTTCWAASTAPPSAR